LAVNTFYLKGENMIEEIESGNDRSIGNTKVTSPDGKVWLIDTASLNDPLISTMDGVLGISGNYETMITPFVDGKNEDWSDYGHKRYETEGEAKEGHKQIIKQVDEGKIKPREREFEDIGSDEYLPQ